MKRFVLVLSALALAPFASAAEIDVSYSDAFTEDLEDDYGMKEGDYLAREIRKDIERELTKAGIDAARIDVTILRATPNRPTFKQLGARPGLDLGRSIGIGGMKLAATAYDADGTAMGSMEYGWFESNISFVAGYATWTDAHKASNWFARRLAKELTS